MEPTNTFEKMALTIMKKYSQGKIVVGILIADFQQTKAREYILNYMDRFDIKSGKYIDFYIPGYYSLDEKEEAELSEKYHPLQDIRSERYGEGIQAYYIRRTQTQYYFSRELFDDFISEMENRMKIEYTYNPMLILVEVEKKENRINYLNKIIIELDRPNARNQEYLTRAGQLFDKLFELAKNQKSLIKFGEDIRAYYFCDNIMDDFVRTLDGEYFEVVRDLVQDLIHYRVKPI